MPKTTCEPVGEGAARGVGLMGDTVLDVPSGVVDAIVVGSGAARSNIAAQQIAG